MLPATLTAPKPTPNEPQPRLVALMSMSTVTLAPWAPGAAFTEAANLVTVAYRGRQPGIAWQLTAGGASLVRGTIVLVARHAIWATRSHAAGTAESQLAHLLTAAGATVQPLHSELPHGIMPLAADFTAVGPAPTAPRPSTSAPDLSGPPELVVDPREEKLPGRNRSRPPRLRPGMTVIVDLEVEGRPVEQRVQLHIPGDYPRQRYRPNELRQLVVSIGRGQLLNPILVWRERDGRFWLIAGLLRLQALLTLGRTRIPARAIDCDDEAEALAFSLADNELRSALQPFERERLAYLLVRRHGWIERRVAQLLSCTDRQVRLLIENYELPADLQQLRRQHGARFPAASARLLGKQLANDPAARRELAAQAVAGHLTFDQLKDRLAARNGAPVPNGLTALPPRPAATAAGAGVSLPATDVAALVVGMTVLAQRLDAGDEVPTGLDEVHRRARHLMLSAGRRLRRRPDQELADLQAALTRTTVAVARA